MFLNPPKQLPKLGPVRRGVRGFRLACYSLARPEGNELSMGMGFAVIMSLIVFAVIGLVMLLAALSSNHPAALVLVGAGFFALTWLEVACICVYPKNLPLTENDYYQIEKLIKSRPEWTTRVASWAAHNDQQLDTRHLRALQRADRWHDRLGSWTRKLSVADTKHLRGMLGGQMGALIDQESLDKTTPVPQTPNRTTPRL